MALAPGQSLPLLRQQFPNGDAKLFAATLGFEAYAPHVTAPLLWHGATNDFHGIMDDTYRTGELIPHANVRYSFTPHMNHWFTLDFAVTRPLWFDQYLRGSFIFPKTPSSKLVLATHDHVPEFRVTPDASHAVSAVHLYYSVDPDPRARFWRSAETTASGGTWTAKLPILSVERPLFAFANVVYELKKPEQLPHSLPAHKFAISSLLHTAAPTELQGAAVTATDKPSRVIEDFSRSLRDWYLLSADNPHHWEYSTRKLADPKWQGGPNQRLALDVQAEKPNDVVIVLTTNFFQSYRGKSQEFTAVEKLLGGEAVQTVSLEPKDFQTSDGISLSSWRQVDVLSLRAYHQQGDTLIGSKNWAGRRPVIRKLQWD